MNLYEYQAKDLLRQFDIPLLPGKVIHSSDEADQVLAELGGDFWIVKAQIYAGGRGKAGGIIPCYSRREVEQAAKKLLHKPLVTSQTDAQGQIVDCVYIEEGCQIQHEFYLGLTLNRHHSCISLIGSAAGGINVEESSQQAPKSIEQILIDPFVGLRQFHSQRLKSFLGLTQDVFDKFHACAENLYRAYTKLDATLLEINPLVLTAKGDWVALDAKLSIDENSLYRQPTLLALDQYFDKNSTEQKAHQHGLSYVKLEGDIGCMVNGAGLAMATLDLIQSYGGHPANFLDVGGGADKERVKIAFELILRDPDVKAIFINIFGGIIRCDLIAEGIIAAVQETHLKVPLVVRLQGTHHLQGLELLQRSGLPIITAENLAEAAQKVIIASKGEV